MSVRSQATVLSAALSKAIAAALPELGPIETLRLAFAAVIEMLEQNRRFSEPRQHIISATPALQEREVAKRAAITRGVGEALQKRGIEIGLANLAAQTGLAVLSYALEAWFADSSSRLAYYIDRGFAELRTL